MENFEGGRWVVFRSTWPEWAEEALTEAGLKPGTSVALGGFQGGRAHVQGPRKLTRV